MDAASNAFSTESTLLPKAVCRYAEGPAVGRRTFPGPRTSSHHGREPLSAVREAIGKLTGLTTLILSGNQLTTLPEATGNLTALVILWLDDDHLTVRCPRRSVTSPHWTRSVCPATSWLKALDSLRTCRCRARGLRPSQRAMAFPP